MIGRKQVIIRPKNNLGIIHYNIHLKNMNNDKIGKLELIVAELIKD